MPTKHSSQVTTQQVEDIEEVSEEDPQVEDDGHEDVEVQVVPNTPLLLQPQRPVVDRTVQSQSASFAAAAASHPETSSALFDARLQVLRSLSSLLHQSYSDAVLHDTHSGAFILSLPYILSPLSMTDVSPHQKLYTSDRINVVNMEEDE